LRDDREITPGSAFDSFFRGLIPEDARSVRLAYASKPAAAASRLPAFPAVAATLGEAAPIGTQAKSVSPLYMHRA
jgi:hypothetical protein